MDMDLVFRQYRRQMRSQRNHKQKYNHNQSRNCKRKLRLAGGADWRNKMKAEVLYDQNN